MINSKLSFLIVLMIVLAFIGSVNTSFAANQQNKMDNYSKSLIKKEAQWITTKCQRNTGAICIYSDQKNINPYFASIAAIGLCYSPKYRYGAKKWIIWYFNHLNSKDYSGLKGTVYDYKVINGKEIATGDYDSTDSYAALFLTLCRTYYKKTGDSKIFKSKKSQIVAIANVILKTQQPDGLTWAKPNYKVKYLMDNSESYKGLMDMAYICQNIYHDLVLAKKYRKAALKIKKGVNKKLWNSKNGSYYWEMYESGDKTACSWKRWYADAESQLWPVWCDLINKKSHQANELYKKLCHYHNWEHLTSKKEPVCIVGEISAIMNKNDAKLHRNSATAVYLKKHPWPWHCGEAGAFIVECAVIGHK